MILFFRTPTNSVIATACNNEFNAEDIKKLCWLYDNATVEKEDNLKGYFIGPRREMITPWSTNAVEITQNMGLTGIRRIEAVTAEAAEDYTFVLQDSIRELRAMFNNVPNLALTIRKSIEENAELKKQINDYVKEKVQHLKKELVANAQEKNGVKVIVFKGNANVEVIKDLAFQIKGEAPMDGKIFFVGGIKDGAKCCLLYTS